MIFAKKFTNTLKSIGSNRVFYRLISAKVTTPIDSSAKVLRHLQFKEIIPFVDGLAIQEKFVRANLDFKQLQGKIRSQLAQLKIDHPEREINPNERNIIDNIMEMKPHPMILTFQFEPTYTGGKRIKKSITKEQITQFEMFQPLTQRNNKHSIFVQTERGGQITFHGPGQVVAYLIMDLKSFHNFSARDLISTIEYSTINTLKNTLIDDNGSMLNIKTKLTENTGVWTVDDAKIASIGVHVRRSITSHGVCINVNTDLSYMNSFDLCGIHNGLHTSIQERRPDLEINTETVAINFVKEMAKLLGIDTVERIQVNKSDIL